MTSPFLGIADNATITFKSVADYPVRDELGNVTVATDDLVCRAYLKGSDRSSRPDNFRPPGISPDAWYCEGYVVDIYDDNGLSTGNTKLPTTVVAPCWAECSFSGNPGYLYIIPPINPPHGREGIGAVIESVAGTKLSGWFQTVAGKDTRFG